MEVDAFNVNQDSLGLGHPGLTDSTPWAARPMADWRERGYVPDSDDEDEDGLGGWPSTDDASEVPATPLRSQESNPSVTTDEAAWDAEHERRKGNISATGRNASSSQEVEDITAVVTKSGADEECSQSCSFGRAATEDSERENCVRDVSRSGLVETHEADEAVPAASVADQLQAELEYGLRSVRDILGDAYLKSRPESIGRGQSSSTLSSIQSLTDDGETTAAAGQSRPEPVPTDQIVAGRLPSQDHQNGSPRYRGRDLRRRNPIQLHPYALEDARYQQELKARGLEPVRITCSSSGMLRDKATEDSQDQSLFSSSPMADSAEVRSLVNLESTLHSQDVAPPEGSRAAPYSGLLVPFDDDEELPELLAILGGGLPELHARKRRKIIHKPLGEASNSLAQNEFHIPELPPADLNHSDHEDMDMDMLEIPPSPPHSSSSNISDTIVVPDKISGPTEGMTPRGLPTPAASSLIKAQPGARIETGYSSDSSRNSKLDQSSVTGSPPLTSDVRQGKGIHSMRRRIKGVLPASWLTLDLDKQTTKNRLRGPSGGSPVKTSGVKGVAQRLKSTRRQLSVAEDSDVPVIDISDDSLETGSPHIRKASLEGASALLEDDDGGEIYMAEDNSFNAISPPFPRNWEGAQIPTERHRTVHEIFVASGVPQSDRSEVLQTSHKLKKQSMLMDNNRSQWKEIPRRTGPISRRQGILGAPAFTQLALDSQPQFLRVVARRVRTQRDKGPADKRYSVPLISEAGRQDVNLGSSDPQESRVRSRGNKVPLLGRNLRPRPLSDDQVSPQNCDFTKTPTKQSPTQHPDEFASLKSSTAPTFRQILLRQLGSAVSNPLHNSTVAAEVSSAYTGLVQHTSLPRRLLSRYRNRSGTGHLTSSLAPISAPRPAQLETSQSRASQPQLVALDHRTLTSNTAVSIPNFLSQAVPQRRLRRKKVPQQRKNHQPGSTAAKHYITSEHREGKTMDLRPGTFFRDLTFAGYDDLVKIIRKVREMGYDSMDYVNLVQLLRTFYGNNNMDEPFAERVSSSREFLDNYRGRGNIQLPTNSDLGFDAFIKLVIITGQRKIDSGEKTSSLSSFIFSLIPNSGRLLRKDQALDSNALSPVQNRHDLYSALYFIAPLETKLRLLPQISNLVDLKESHISACTISLKTLVRLTHFQFSAYEDPRVLYHFGKSFQGMIKKMEEQFDAARLEASTQSGGTLPRRDSLRRIMRFNQDKIQNFLIKVLQGWADCIRNCYTAEQARYLLFGDDIGAVLSLCNRTIAVDRTDGRDGRDTVAFRDEVVEVILSTITSFILNWLPLATDLKGLIDGLHFPLKNVLSTQLGRSEQCSDKILRSLINCWHALAKISVHHNVKSWDNYLSPGGCDVWQSFDDTWHKREYEIYFAARFIEFNQNVWHEWQVPMLDLWIRSLLIPEAHFKYQADMTAQIMRYDASSNPLLFHLPLVICRDTCHIHVQLDDLIAGRTAIVLALIRNMNNATVRPESQDSFGGPIGPNTDDYSAMLKSMITAMKQYLGELEWKSAEQKIYGDFASLVLSKMRVCTTHLEPVPDILEYMPGSFLPMAPSIIKTKLGLYRQQMGESGIEKHMIVFLHTAAERAAITGQQEAFAKELVDVFLDLTPESLEDPHGYAADARFRTLFFQNVFPAYLDRIFSGSGFIIARPILGCILSVYKGLRFRFGLWTKEYLEPFIIATLSLLSTLKTTLAGSVTSAELVLANASQYSAYALLCSIMCEMLSRCQEIEDSSGSCSGLSDVWEYFLFFYQCTLKVAFRPPQVLPEELRDEDDDTFLSEPRLSMTDGNMLMYSRRELGDILDFKWVPGYKGMWFVNRAGGRREQVQASGIVGSVEQETSHMQAAAQRYMGIFARLWSAC